MFTNPVQNLKSLGIREGDVVGDLGAGTGFYTLALSPMVPQGKVYAVELHEDYIKTIQNKAREHHFKNVDCLPGDIERVGGTKLGDETLDKAVISNVLHQLEDTDKFISELKRILKTGGKILVIDWSEEGSVFKAKHIVHKKEARKIFENGGFVWERDIDAGAHHYGMIFNKL